MSKRGEMSPRRRRTSPPPASLPDDDDMLQEILLRLPPRPSSLPRASRVCKRWRRLVQDPRFQRRFRDHHGKHPLLGFFLEDYRSCPFVPTLDRPDRIPRDHFSMSRRQDNRIVDCRHGLVLFLSGRPPRRPSVWDPVARKQRCLILPPELDNDQMYFFNRAVLRPACGQGRRSSQFQVALLAYDDRGKTRASAWVYSSETGIWSNSKSLQLQSSIVPMDQSSTLIGSSLYWLHTYAAHVLPDHHQYVVLEFDLNRQSLAVTELPAHIEPGYHTLRIMPAEDGGLGFIHLSGFNAQLWKRKPDCDGSGVWVLSRAIEFGELRSTCKGDSLKLVGFAEESNAILVLTASGVFVVYLQSMEFKKLSNTVFFFPHYPFECCYAAGTGIVDVHGRDEVLKYMGDACLFAHVSTL